MAAEKQGDISPSSTESPEPPGSEDPEIARLLDREQKRIARLNAYLMGAGCLGIVLGVATLIWYRRVPAEVLEDVAKGVIINMIAAGGVLGLLLGVCFIGLAVHIKRNKQAADKP